MNSLLAGVSGPGKVHADEIMEYSDLKQNGSGFSPVISKAVIV